MIVLTNLHGEQLAINDELIERVEGDHETRVILTSGTRYIVAESVEEVVRRCRQDRAEVLALSRRLGDGPAHPDAGADLDDEDDDARPVPDPRGREGGELHVLRPLGRDVTEDGAG